MDEGEVFDLNAINEYELLSNEDGTVLIQDNCVVIKHKQTAEIKMLPLSDEVLQALGLALVLEDEDLKKESGVQIHMEEGADEEDQSGTVLQEYIMERVEDPEDAIPASIMAKQETQRMNEDDNAEQDDGPGLTTFVFTDDEDADLDKSQEDGTEEEDAVQGRDKNVLAWSPGMVGALLDLYEELQLRFQQNRNHKQLWREIYVRMCVNFPELKKWSELHVQSKFNGLKRTYKGAALYFKENMHTTKWVYFDRMKRIMDKAGEGEADGGTEYKSKPDWSQNQQALQWKRKWTLKMLDVYLGARCGGERGAVFWSSVRDLVIASEPDFEVVTVEQLKRKMFNLKRVYRAHRARPQLRLAGEFKDKALLQRVARVCEGEGSGSGEAGSESEPEREQHWTRAHTEHLLDLCAGAGGGARSEIIEQVSERMRQRFGDENDFSAAKCQQKLSSLRHSFNGIVERKPPGAWKTVTWPYFEKSMKIFHKPMEIWSRANTLLLVELYARVRRYLDEHGARFWAELADKIKQQKPGLSVTPRKCEMKMQALFAKYRAALARGPEQRGDSWPLFKKMDAIFGLAARDAWPLHAQQQMLTLYQQRLHLLEAGAAPLAVYNDIAGIMTKMFPALSVSGEACSARLLELKGKFVKLSHDARAAAAWPLYTRMSEIFSTHLWSRSNVNHLLDAYCEVVGAGGAGGGGGGAGAGGVGAAVWARVAALFTKRSPAGAAAAFQCRTEFNVLRTRYNTLKSGNPAAAEKWPFYEKMRKIFGDADTPKPAAAPVYQTIITDMGHIKVELLKDVQDSAQLNDAVDEQTQQAVQALHSAHAGSPQHSQSTTDAADSDSQSRRSHKSQSRQSRNSRDSDESQDSIADKLEELLVERPAKRIRTESPERPEPEEEEEAETPTRISTRSVQQKVEWSQTESLQLLDAYGALRGAGGDAPRVWSAVYKRIKNNLSGRKTSGHCSERFHQLKTKYKAMEKSGKTDADEEMPEAIYEKMKALFETAQSKPKENGAIPPLSAGALDGLDHELLQKMLHELETKNEIQKQRAETTKKYFEEKTKRETEKVVVLRKIEHALSKLLQNNDVTHKVLIETLENCLND